MNIVDNTFSWFLWQGTKENSSFGYEMKMRVDGKKGSLINLMILCLNPSTAEWALRALIDFTLSNAERFYSSMSQLNP